MRNINWIRALVDVKAEMRFCSAGHFTSKDYINHSYCDIYTIETNHKNCLGEYNLKEEYFKNLIRFTYTYSLTDKPKGCYDGCLIVDFIPSEGFDRNNNYRDLTTVDVRDKSGIFYLMVPSDLLSNYRTIYSLSYSIEKSKKEWRLNNFIETPRKYPEGYNYSYERVL